MCQHPLPVIPSSPWPDDLVEQVAVILIEQHGHEDDSPEAQRRVYRADAVELLDAVGQQIGGAVIRQRVAAIDGHGLDELAHWLAGDLDTDVASDVADARVTLRGALGVPTP